MGQIPPILRNLIVVNAAVFGLTFLLPELGKTIMGLFALYYPTNDGFQIWQFISYMFLHGSLAHIFFNMFALASFGSPLIILWGKRRFLTFYFVTGIGAGLVYTAVNTFQFSNAYGQMLEAGFTPEGITVLLESFKAEPSMVAKVPRETLEALVSTYHSKAIGASGALYGILVAFGVLFPNAKLSLIFFPVPVAAKYFIPVLIAVDLFSGITGFSIFGGGIAHFAHVGGALIGFIIMLYWKATMVRAPA